jgi:hypothetical protein
MNDSSVYRRLEDAAAAVGSMSLAMVTIEGLQKLGVLA